MVKTILAKVFNGLINLVVTFCIMAMPVVAIAYAAAKEPANNNLATNIASSERPASIVQLDAGKMVPPHRDVAKQPEMGKVRHEFLKQF